MGTILQVRDLVFSRGDRRIFNGMKLTLSAGEMTALIGPNGVGKSTLLALISGLLKPNSGQVELFGREVRKWQRKELSRTVALVPQTLHVPFSFRVSEIVAQGRVPHVGRFGNLSKNDHVAIDRAMEGVDVLPLRNRVFEELSGGEMQRVKIAIALAQEPQLMLLDEPTQHLDLGRQIEVVQLLRQLNGTGITILAAMHDLELVRKNFDKAVVLTTEPACHTLGVEEIMQPEVLESMFGLHAAEYYAADANVIEWPKSERPRPPRFFQAD
ncbi:MAG TPA: ABC transporter ATP-binding protein [Candidatus Acidoferrales bacterium]|nr:ABC transporter ATP-binding protein [Candidatus Acidoferrales bacterium]